MALIAGLLIGCAAEPSPSWRGPGTDRMIERLRQIAAELQPQQHPYVVSARLDSALAVAPPADPADRLRFEASLARAALEAGRIEEAITRLEEVVSGIGRSPDRVSPAFQLRVLEFLAVAHLKRWERENCVAARRSDLCRLPIDEGAKRSAEADARTAVRVLESMLESAPGELNYAWLLNVGHMMLGRHPRAVPPRWRIPSEAFRSEYDIRRFPERARELGLDVAGHAGGAVMDDFDGDGYLDLVVSSWHLTDPMRFFRNNGDGTFSDRTAAAGLEGLTGGLNLVQADYDNDGDLDLLVLRGAWTPYGEPNSLLRNNGDGTFEDVTEAAGLWSVYPTQTASWGDYDQDGWIDLYVGNESVGGRRIPNQLYRNNGDGTFTDVASEVGAAVAGFVKAVVWGDYNNDGRPDLYISRLRQPNVLLRNDGPDAEGRWRFSDVTAEAGVAEPVPSFPVWFWDYDNDGWLDLFVGGYQADAADVAAEYMGLRHGAEFPRLYRNTRDGTFRDVTASVRLDRVMLAMGCNYGDLDNDGYEDLYVGTGMAALEEIVPNRMLRNAAGERFQDVTTSGGFGHLGKGHGVAFGDIDNDGDQEIYASIGGAHEVDVGRDVLFENPGHRNRWITLRLEGVRSSRDAIGARVRVTVETASGLRTIHRVVTSGGSFGANSLQQEIGLGRATAIRSIEIVWPATGMMERFEEVEMDRIYRVREGEGSLTPVAVRSFRLGPR